MMGASYHHVGIGDIFNDLAVFEYKTSFIPRRCYNTGRWIWGVAMRGRRHIIGPKGKFTLTEDRWYHRHEAVIMILKGLSNGNI